MDFKMEGQEIITFWIIFYFSGLILYNNYWSYIHYNSFWGQSHLELNWLILDKVCETQVLFFKRGNSNTYKLCDDG